MLRVAKHYALHGYSGLLHGFERLSPCPEFGAFVLRHAEQFPYGSPAPRLGGRFLDILAVFHAKRLDEFW